MQPILNRQEGLPQVQQTIASQIIGEIADLSQQINNGYYIAETKLIELSNAIHEKMFELIEKAPYGNLTEDSDSLKKIDECIKNNGYIFCKFEDLWKNYTLLNEYIRSNELLKPALLQKIEEALRDFTTDTYFCPLILKPDEWLDKRLIKAVYSYADVELVRLFQKYLPIPPLSVFDPNNQPQILVQRELDKKNAFAAFKQRNVEDSSLETKVIYFQREIRHWIREKAEIERIANRHFSHSKTATADAIRMIEDANTPYRPKKCSPELADRILNAALQVKLFHNVFHLCDPKNIASILDDCLYGRRNLVYSYKTFRPAVLHRGDIKNGDGNVICLGSDMIAEDCYQDRTLAIELDIELLTKQEEYQKNRTLFFKQRDLEYGIKTIQSINIGGDELWFTHTQLLPCSKENHTNLQLFDSHNNLNYLSEVKKDLFISNNMKDMHQILSLNFFRFLDTLCKVNSDSADSETQRIYDKISKLDDNQLQKFILELGKKMSFSSEFNIYGAYKIDLNALRSITIYNNKTKIDSISIDVLCGELSRGDRTSWNLLKRHVPEIVSSTRFISFIASKVPAEAMEEFWTDIVK